MTTTDSRPSTPPPTDDTLRGRLVRLSDERDRRRFVEHERRRARLLAEASLSGRHRLRALPWRKRATAVLDRLTGRA